MIISTRLKKSNSFKYVASLSSFLRHLMQSPQTTCRRVCSSITLPSCYVFGWYQTLILRHKIPWQSTSHCFWSSCRNTAPHGDWAETQKCQAAGMALRFEIVLFSQYVGFQNYHCEHGWWDLQSWKIFFKMCWKVQNILYV